MRCFVCQIVANSCGKGDYHDDHKQFNTSSVFRTACHNQVACSALNSGSNLSLGNEKGEYQCFAHDATASVWYHRLFRQGCKKRVGQDWHPNREISIKLMHLVLKVCEDHSKMSTSTFDKTADWIIAGTYFETEYVCSLRGPEHLLVDLEDLPAMIVQVNANEIMVPASSWKGESRDPCSTA
jgi:hypothetical protein